MSFKFPRELGILSSYSVQVRKITCNLPSKIKRRTDCHGSDLYLEPALNRTPRKKNCMAKIHGPNRGLGLSLVALMYQGYTLVYYEA
jgi:hypothetical protein